MLFNHTESYNTNDGIHLQVCLSKILLIACTVESVVIVPPVHNGRCKRKNELKSKRRMSKVKQVKRESSKVGVSRESVSFLAEHNACFMKTRTGLSFIPQ